MMKCWLYLRGRFSGLIVAASFLHLMSGCGSAYQPAPAVADQLPEVVDFTFHIKPLLSDRCFACHGPDANKRESGLRLDVEEQALRTRLEAGGYAFVPGSLRQSVAWTRIMSDDPDLVMPPPASHLSLTPYEKALIARWIEQGAEYKPHWAFSPPVKPALPDLEHPAMALQPLDHFVLKRLEQEGITPAPPADKETLIRRVSLDLTGLPPLLEEVEAFMADTTAQAYERVVDRLLASPHFGERMAAEWLDLARYADTHGYQDDGDRTMWPWRDWVIGQFNENQPFDSFITWQLAGDLLPQPSRSQVLATAFLRNHMQNQEGGIVPEEYRVEYVVDRVRTTSKAFLGLTMECAQCHDHKYDPITQREYYQFYSFFNQNNETGAIPYAGEASPVVILTDSATAAIQAYLDCVESQALELRQMFQPGRDRRFQAWLSRTAPPALTPATITGLVAYYPFDTLRADKLPNLTSPSRPAVFSQANLLLKPATIPGPVGKAQQLRGDGFIDIGPEVGKFEHNEPFTVSFWLNVLGDSLEGPVFARTGGLFDGNRGYECLLRPDGRLTFGLNHVWPDNCIEIRLKKPLPIQSWHHVSMVYDGSGKASGVQIWIDGQQALVDIVNDNLRQSILYARKKTNWNYHSFRIGRRQEESLDSVALDEFRIYRRNLTPLELMALSGQPDPLSRAWQERAPQALAALYAYYQATADPGFQAVNEELRTARAQVIAALTESYSVMVMHDLPAPRPTFILDRGQYDSPADSVTSYTPASLGVFPAALPRNRLGLAQWLTDPRHPLTARVTVNRYWQLLFGQGLVRTPDDFGNQGALPTHPALLDWLAVSFVESGWDLKALLKTIVLSSTYRQSSVYRQDLAERDPQNDLLARGPAVRLTAEMMRDQALTASGLLVRKLGGSSVKPYQPEGLWDQLAIRNGTRYVQQHGDSLYRRSLYTFWKRTIPPPSMITFDAAERSACTVKRQHTTTPLQALVLLNDPQFIEASRALAQRTLREVPGDPQAQISRLFRRVTSRHPTPGEMTTLMHLYESERAAYRREPARVQALLRVGEFPFDKTLQPAETGAMTLVASTVFNLDEAIFKR
ncbi:MAG: DUF1553 domain-containing protein [Bacteroidia bacterium]|nr:DUF1553 domain-containing protein [Bacteroidia bacterium]